MAPSTAPTMAPIGVLLCELEDPSALLPAGSDALPEPPDLASLGEPATSEGVALSPGRMTVPGVVELEVEKVPLAAAAAVLVDGSTTEMVDVFGLAVVTVVELPLDELPPEEPPPLLEAEARTFVPPSMNIWATTRGVVLPVLV